MGPPHATAGCDATRTRRHAKARGNFKADRQHRPVVYTVRRVAACVYLLCATGVYRNRSCKVSD